jgi:outer membrane protein assembly factor BamB
MLSVNYIQYTKANPLNTPALNTLKERLDAEPENLLLQQQIREFDLLARKVYFTGKEQVRIGVYILLAASLILLVSLRFLYASYKNLPEKEIDRLDEWAIKTLSRKYVTYGGIGLLAMAITIAFVSQYNMDDGSKKIEMDGSKKINVVASTTDSASVESGNDTEPVTALVSSETEKPDTAVNIPETEKQDVTALTTPAVIDSVKETKPVEPTLVAETAPVSKVTHNGFRGNNGSATSSAKNVPTDFDLSAGKNILWKTNIPLHGYNSPVINSNKVFFTGADDNVRELFCYDLTSGALLWALKAENIPGSPAKAPKTTDDTGLAASTVAANAQIVCAIFATGDLIAADHSGNRLWAKNLGIPDNHYGYASSLLMYNNLLIVQYDQNNGGKVFALDAATGGERWSKTREDKITWASPIIAHTGNRTELILMGTPNITSYNPANGEEYWKVKCLSGEVGSSPVHAGGIIFGASEYATLAAINSQDGTIIWENNDYLPEISSTAATSSCVFLATSYGTLVCRDAKTGEENKIHELNEPFYSSPMIVEGKLYLFDTSGNLYVFSADKECRLLNTVKTGEKTFATPAFTDGKMVVRSDNSIYCVAKI